MEDRRPLQPDVAEKLDEFLGTKGALSVAVSRLRDLGSSTLVTAWVGTRCATSS